MSKFGNICLQNFWRLCDQFFVRSLNIFSKFFTKLFKICNKNLKKSSFWRIFVKISKNFLQNYLRVLIKFQNILMQTFWIFYGQFFQEFSTFFLKFLLKFIGEFVNNVVKIFLQGFEEFPSKCWRAFSNFSKIPD